MRASNFQIIDGWCAGVHRKESPNADERPIDVVVDLLVIHAISLPPDRFGDGYVIDFFQNKLPTSDHTYFAEIADLKVSSHFFIDREGVVTQFVSTELRAWHCGESQFCGRTKCNDFSIGVELEGCDTVDFEDVQYAQLGELTHAIRDAYPNITPARVTGHSDIAPGRKTDPGPCFDWQRYRRSF